MGSSFRLCIWAKSFPGPVGGLQSFLAEFVQYLHEQGVDFVALTTKLTDVATSFAYPIIPASDHRKMRDEIRRSDLVYALGFNLFVVVLAHLNGKPIVWDHGDHDLVCPKGIAWNGQMCHYVPRICANCLGRDWEPVYVLGLPISLRIHRFVARFLPRVVHLFHSHQHLQKALESSPNLRGWHVVPRPVRHFCNPSFRDISRSPSRILFVGRLTSEKGCQILLEALRYLPGATLDVVGDGWYREELELVVGKFGIAERVTFHGELTGRPLQELWASCDVFVLPSLWVEPLGQVAAEAAAMGMSVVASDTVGATDFLGEGVLTFESGNIDDLVSKLSQVLQEGGDAPLRFQAHAMVSNLTWERIGPKYLAILKDVAELQRE